MKKKRVMLLSGLFLLLGVSGANAFGLPSFIKDNLPGPVSDTIENIVDTVGQKALAKYGKKATDKLLGELGLADPLEMANTAGDSEGEDDSLSETLSSDIVSDMAGQEAIDQISNSVLSDDGQLVQGNINQAVDSAVDLISESSAIGQKTPVTQRLIKQLLKQNEALSKIATSTDRTLKNSLSQQAATNAAINQQNKRNSRIDLKETREQAADVDNSLNESAFGTQIGEGKYW
jgi:hypothetical protein